MKPSLYPVRAPEGARVWLMPKPSGEWLNDDISHYAAVGIDRVVSFLEPDEARELGLMEEAEACRKRGIAFDAFAIPDRGVPDERAFTNLIQRLAGRAAEGEGIAFHCRAGIGRASMGAATLLIALGLEADEALQRVGEARGVQVPDTAEQEAFIAACSPTLRPKRVCV